MREKISISEERKLKICFINIYNNNIKKTLHDRLIRGLCRQFYKISRKYYLKMTYKQLLINISIYFKIVLCQNRFLLLCNHDIR